jgi:hypothetical protein
MSVLSFADTVFALRFLRLLTMPYEKTAAYKTGAIGLDGKTLMPVSDMTAEQKESYTLFHRLVFNIRRLLSKVPIVGKSILTNYATAILMLKEETGIDETVILDALRQLLPIEDYSLEENKFELINNFQYTLSRDMIHPKTGEYRFKENSKIIIKNKLDQKIFGIDLYEAIHPSTNQKIIICEGDVVVSPTNTIELIPPRETKDLLFSKTPIKRKSKKKKESLVNEKI